MKNAIQFVLLMVSVNLSAQTSTFYGNYNVNQNINANVNINKKVDVSGNINKTITTIDYGQLAAANAQREANRLSSMQYANDLNRQQALEIANDPNKAFTYGKDNSYISKVNRKLTDYTGGVISLIASSKNKRTYKNRGFEKYTFYHKIPHSSLFTATSGYNYINESEDGVVTEIEIGGGYKLDGLDEKEPWVRELKSKFKNGAEEAAKNKNYTEGVSVIFSDGSEGFCHKKNVNRATVFGIRGFKGTSIFEDKYEYLIEDNYVAMQNGIIFYAKVKFHGDKDEINFEDLEGRRYYFKLLINNMISTAALRDIK